MAEEPEVVEVGFRGITLRASLANDLDRKFWTDWLPKGWEGDTFRFVDAHVRPGAVFVDIGAWTGPISLYAASLGARVIAIEPDPVAYDGLSRNVALNAGRLKGSVETMNAAFDSAPGEVRIFGARKGFGRSTSSMLVRGGTSVLCPAVTWEDLAAKAGAPAVLKVDIEAHEFACAPALARLRRALGAPMHLSVHPNLLLKSMGWRRWLPGAREEVCRRTAALLAAFSGSDLRATDLPHDLDTETLKRRLHPANGKPADFALIATGR